MLNAPLDLHEDAITTVLTNQWGVVVDELTYLPVGFGSHHWLARPSSGTELFVKVDDAPNDARFQQLVRAYGSALRLQTVAGLEFVLGPIPDQLGQAVCRLDERYAVTVFPEVAGESGEFLDARSPDEREAALLQLARLHGSTDVVADLADVDDLAIEKRTELDLALERLDTKWDAGPYSERARALLAENQDLVRRVLREYDGMAEQVASRKIDWTVTHGETHPGNYLRSEYATLLIDWETLRLSAPERDLWLLSTDVDDLSTYARAVGRPIDELGLHFFELRWLLTDVALFVDDFVCPHADTADISATWKYLQRTLAFLGERQRRRP